MNHHISVEKTVPLFETILKDALVPAIAWDVATSLIECGWHLSIWSLPNTCLLYTSPSPRDS